jgi:mannan endo-1,4-beta-mannosidase
MKHRLVSLARTAKPFVARWLTLTVLCTLALLGTLTVASGTALAATQPDVTAPSRPATPAIDTITPIVATFHPTGSVDNDAVAGYSALRLLNGAWTQWTFTNIDVDIIVLRDLSPGTTYTVAVVAFDNAGNQSPRSGSLTFTTPSKPAPTCRVQRTVFGTTFMIQVFVENLTTVPTGNWTVTFTMPATQTVNYLLGVNIARNGDRATFTGVSPIASVVPGMTANFGTIANNPAGAALPSNFAFNSPAFGTMSCAVS